MTATQDQLEGLGTYKFGWSDSDVAGKLARRGAGLAHLGGDDVAGDAVAARRCLGQATVLIDQADRDAVDLGLDYQRQRMVGGMAKRLARARLPVFEQPSALRLRSLGSSGMSATARSRPSTTSAGSVAAFSSESMGRR